MIVSLNATVTVREEYPTGDRAAALAELEAAVTPAFCQFRKEMAEHGYEVHVKLTSGATI